MFSRANRLQLMVMIYVITRSYIFRHNYVEVSHSTERDASVKYGKICGRVLTILRKLIRAAILSDS
ncbi:MAG: hypothetical protein BWK80_37845 [Desulfobacteraceae bacterium IS3]|nr:MAG: hypothetical protein BWK80_37845 [Desulfobacteraceae bacterium IS3]